MTPSDKQLLATEELSLLDEREREAWELCQRVTWQGEQYLKARDLLPALLSKVVRLTRERDESFNEGIRVQTAFTNDQRRRAEAAESRISDLTKENDLLRKTIGALEVDVATAARLMPSEEEPEEEAPWMVPAEPEPMGPFSLIDAITEMMKMYDRDFIKLEHQVSDLTKELEQERSKVVVAEIAAKIARETNIVFNEEKKAAGREKDSALQERDNLVQKYNAVYVRLEKEVKHPNTGMMPLSAELIDLAQWIVKRAEAAESERDRYKERVGVLEKALRKIQGMRGISGLSHLQS